MALLDVSSPRWQAERDKLAQQVALWFREASTRTSLSPPTRDGCRLVAFYLMLYRYRDDNEEPDSRSSASKYGNLFLRHIKPKRREIEEWLSWVPLAQPFGNWVDEYRQMASHIDEIQKHMEALLPRLSHERDAKSDPVRKIAAAAQQAWAESNGGQAPRSRNPDDPLCRFLVPALGAINHNLSVATISEILRGRRRKRKEGQIL